MGCMRSGFTYKGHAYAAGTWQQEGSVGRFWGWEEEIDPAWSTDTFQPLLVPGAMLDMYPACFQRSPDDIGLALIPLFHSFGATVNMLNVIQAGCSTVMMDRLTMDGLFSAIEREKLLISQPFPVSI